MSKVQKVSEFSTKHLMLLNPDDCTLAGHVKNFHKKVEKALDVQSQHKVEYHEQVISEVPGISEDMELAKIRKIQSTQYKIILRNNIREQEYGFVVLDMKDENNDSVGVLCVDGYKEVNIE